MRFHPEAQAELVEAAEWYEERTPGLGERFLDEVEHGLALIAEHPDGAAPWDHRDVEPSIRRLPLTTFPCLVVYDSAELYVVAIAHGRRRPGYWVARL